MNYLIKIETNQAKANNMALAVVGGDSELYYQNICPLSVSKWTYVATSPDAAPPVGFQKYMKHFGLEIVARKLIEVANVTEYRVLNSSFGPEIESKLVECGQYNSWKIRQPRFYFTRKSLVSYQDQTKSYYCPELEVGLAFEEATEKYGSSIYVYAPANSFVCKSMSVSEHQSLQEKGRLVQDCSYSVVPLEEVCTKEIDEFGTHYCQDTYNLDVVPEGFFERFLSVPAKDYAVAPYMEQLYELLITNNTIGTINGLPELKTQYGKVLDRLYYLDNDVTSAPLNVTYEHLEKAEQIYAEIFEIESAITDVRKVAEILLEANKLHKSITDLPRPHRVWPEYAKYSGLPEEMAEVFSLVQKSFTHYVSANQVAKFYQKDVLEMCSFEDTMKSLIEGSWGRRVHTIRYEADLLAVIKAWAKFNQNPYLTPELKALVEDYQNRYVPLNNTVAVYKEDLQKANEYLAAAKLKLVGGSIPKFNDAKSRFLYLYSHVSRAYGKKRQMPEHITEMYKNITFRSAYTHHLKTLNKMLLSAQYSQKVDPWGIELLQIQHAIELIKHPILVVTG